MLSDISSALPVGGLRAAGAATSAVGPQRANLSVKHGAAGKGRRGAGGGGFVGSGVLPLPGSDGGLVEMEPHTQHAQVRGKWELACCILQYTLIYYTWLGSRRVFGVPGRIAPPRAVLQVPLALPA